MRLHPDIIGTLYNNDGTYDDEGNAINPPTAVTGFHVNFTEPVPELEAYRVYPKTPRRVYAGHEPVCYTFPDKDMFDDLCYDVLESS